jgi:hypothetical protein
LSLLTWLDVEDGIPADVLLVGAGACAAHCRRRLDAGVRLKRGEPDRISRSPGLLL